MFIVKQEANWELALIQLKERLLMGNLLFLLSDWNIFGWYAVVLGESGHFRWLYEPIIDGVVSTNKFYKSKLFQSSVRFHLFFFFNK